MDETAVAPATVRYSTVAIILHWLIAALLIFEVGLGLRMEAARGAAKFAAFQLHKSVGITILLLVALRIVWRFFREPPAIEAKGWERALAHFVHALFYVLLFALPISGWVIVSTSQIVVPTLLYGVVPWPHVPGVGEMAPAAKNGWHSAAEFIHVNFVNVIYVLFGLHVAGALKHHFLDRDGDIAKMAPGIRSGSWSDPRMILIGMGVMLAAGLGLQWMPIGLRETSKSQATEVSLGASAPTPITQTETDGGALITAEAPASASSTNAVMEDLASWTIAQGSTLRFRTSWSGEPIEGGFRRFDGDIDFSPDHLDRSRAEVRINMNSAFSGDSQRDETLKSADWFSVGAYGIATFKAERFRKVGIDSYVASGTLRLKGVTLPISLPFTLAIKGEKATMRGTATIDRTAYKIGEGDFASTSEVPAVVKVDVVVHATRK